MSLLKFSALIEALYGAAIDTNGWKGLGSQVARHFGAENCVLQIQDTSIGRAIVLDATANLATGSIASYEAYYHKTDLWVARAALRGRGGAYITSDLTSERELLASEFYNGWLKQTMVRGVAGSVLTLDQSAVGVIGIHRPDDAAQFDEDDRCRLSEFLPHVTRAMQLHQRLKSLELGQRLTLEALEALAVGVIVVGEERRLLFANAMAERLLRVGRESTAAE